MQLSMCISGKEKKLIIYSQYASSFQVFRQKYCMHFSSLLRVATSLAEAAYH
jgi:hypothetical protein